MIKICRLPVIGLLSYLFGFGVSAEPVYSTLLDMQIIKLSSNRYAVAWLEELTDHGQEPSQIIDEQIVVQAFDSNHQLSAVVDVHNAGREPDVAANSTGLVALVWQERHGEFSDIGANPGGGGGRLSCVFVLLIFSVLMATRWKSYKTSGTGSHGFYN